MQWYTGSIPEAVAQSQSTKSLFCVAIFGNDEASTKLLTALDSTDLQAVIEREKVLAIRIDANSPEYSQFGAIYPNVTSPSIYCITVGGVAVQVITGNLDTVQLRNRFNVAFHLHREALKAATSTSGQSPLPASSGSPSLSTNSAAPPVSVDSNPDPIATQLTTSEAGSHQPTLEERIERAKQLAAAKQAQKNDDEAAEVRRRENERRETGKKMAELKRWQAEEEAKRLAEERRKDKEEEAALRIRVRQQIAQDRIDREARVQAEAQAAASSSTSPAAPTKQFATATDPQSYTGMARLQFRLPDGSSHAHVFSPDSTLEQVRTYLIANVAVLPKGFVISIAFPRRVLTPEDYGLTLRDLDLLPSATLLILAAPETSMLPRGGAAGGVMAMLYAALQVLLLPFTFIWAWFRPVPGETTKPEKKQDEVPGSSTGAGGRGQGRVIPPRRNIGKDEETVRKRGTESGQGQSFGRPDGNIHRFPTSHSDSDDEQGTYNGNSTQQM